MIVSTVSLPLIGPRRRLYSCLTASYFRFCRLFNPNVSYNTINWRDRFDLLRVVQSAKEDLFIVKATGNDHI